MLPMLARLKPALSRCGRLTLAVSALTLLGVPTFYGVARSQEVEPAAKSIELKAQSVDSDAVVTKDKKLQTQSKPANARPPLPPMAAPLVEFLPALSAKEKEILEKLEKPVQFDFTRDSLEDVVSEISKSHRLPIVIKRNPLEENSIAVDARDISLKLSEVSLHSALKILQEAKNVEFIIQDGVLTLTSPDDAISKMVTRTYPVRDLVGNVDVDYELLVKAITRGVAGRWTNEGGGFCSAAMLPATGCLVIRHTWQGHDEVLKLLRVLREVNKENRTK